MTVRKPVRRYELRKKAAEALHQTWEAAQSLGAMAVEYDREYKVSERAGQAIQESFYYAYDTAKEVTATWTFPSAAQQPTVPPNSQI
jgi:hypothetical protein